VLYSCNLSGKVVSICADPATVSYRFGALGNPELQIRSSPADKAHVGSISGGGGGYQDSLRFTHDGYDYIVYSASGGALTDVAGKEWSGVAVKSAGRDVAKLRCTEHGPQQELDTESLAQRADVADDDDDLGWF
jgi:hypothetical protein